MKVKTWIPLGLAIVLGLIAAKMTRDSMSHGKAEPEDKNTVVTLTAAHDIEPGQKLTPMDVMEVKMPAGVQPVGSFPTAAALNNRVAITRMVKGQTVLEGLLAPEGTAAGVQALIPEGMRAITIQVTEFSGLAGLLIPGCKVDIISIIRTDKELGQVARTIVQNVEVRAVGRTISAAAAPAGPADSGPGAPPVPIANNVTLLVTPSQAEAVQLASIGGSPWLVLRNTNDKEPIETAGTSMADLRGDTRALDTNANPVKAASDPFAEKGAPLAPKTRTVVFIRNNKEQVLTVDNAPTAPLGETVITDTSAERAPIIGK